MSKLKLKMTQELSGVTVVFIVSTGILTFILLFIFAKRQIMRFALRSRRGPHVPIGHGAKKVGKKCILEYNLYHFKIQVYINYINYMPVTARISKS